MVVTTRSSEFRRIPPYRLIIVNKLDRERASIHAHARRAQKNSERTCPDSAADGAEKDSKASSTSYSMKALNTPPMPGNRPTDIRRNTQHARNGRKAYREVAGRDTSWSVSRAGRRPRTSSSTAETGYPSHQTSPSSSIAHTTSRSRHSRAIARSSPTTSETLAVKGGRKELTLDRRAEGLPSALVFQTSLILLGPSSLMRSFLYFKSVSTYGTRRRDQKSAS